MPEVFMFFNNLSSATKPEDIQAALASRALEVPIENISVRTYPDHCCSARVTFSDENVEYIFKQHLWDLTVLGRRLTAKRPRSSAQKVLLSGAL